MLLNVYDRSIIEVENHIGLIDARLMMFQALNRMFEEQPQLNSEKAVIQQKIEQAFEIELEEVMWSVLDMAGQGCLFPRNTSVPKFFCHGLGAHIMYPETRTVLDIGGQDTKAIQVDRPGLSAVSR